jgi:hypothetical protein
MQRQGGAVLLIAEAVARPTAIREALAGRWCNDRMRRVGLLIAATALVVGGCGGSNPNTTSTTQVAGCTPGHVHYTHYPGHAKGLSGPWICGTPRSNGLVGLLAYWPRAWRRSRLDEPRIYAGGKTPAATSTKILWVFLANSARNRGGDELTVRGRRLDGPGTTHQRFAAIGYAGQDHAPSYASIIDLPRPGRWRLRLSTGTLHGTIEPRAIRG